MDKNRAIQLLRQYVGEIAYLRKLHHRNEDLNPWDQKVRRLLEERFTRKSWEYKEFVGALTQLFRPTSDAEKQGAYNSYLDHKETALKRIIEKHEKSICQKLCYELKDSILTLMAKFGKEIVR